MTEKALKILGQEGIYVMKEIWDDGDIGIKEASEMQNYKNKIIRTVDILEAKLLDLQRKWIF